MKRIANIKGTVKYFKENGWDDASEYYFRQGAISGSLPAFKNGNMWLFDLDLLEAHIAEQAMKNLKQSAAENNTYGKLRKIGI